LAVVPFVALLVGGAWASRQHEGIERASIPLLLVVSYLAAPFAWPADAVLLIPVQVAVVAAVVNRRRGAGVMLSLLAVSQVGARAVDWLPDTDLHHQIVLPLGLLVVAGVWRHRARSEIGELDGERLELQT
jgi:heme exporter protein D